ncbi:hypothetical protein H4219_003212 [Mycoemilia scoparia]|uniref:DPH-type MB domain-containing protein n=1 Tax=Mycoemilia scoparia TaxID=417184 RepID=A0A9W7ZVG8_9FUNG|nr:hypothetical protein H4219_003212 [Mycoemilia scoparia]
MSAAALDQKPAKDTITKNVNDAGTDVFIEIHKAWETLKDPVKRQKYDETRQLEMQRSRGVVQDEVDLDDMEFNEDWPICKLKLDTNLEEFSYLCRCSGSYIIRYQDLEDGHDLAYCTQCSLKIRVLYGEVVDSQDEE